MKSLLEVSLLSVPPRDQNGGLSDLRLLREQKAWYNIPKTVAIF